WRDAPGVHRRSPVRCCETVPVPVHGSSRALSEELPETRLRRAGRSARDPGPRSISPQRPGSCPPPGPPPHSRAAMPDSPDLGSIRERQHPRVEANLPVEVKGPGMLRQAIAEDISLAGLRLLALRPPPAEYLTL